MIKTITQTWLDIKVGLGTAGISIGWAWIMDKLQWLDSVLPKMVTYAGLVLTLVLIVSHICSNIRQNRKLEMEAEEHRLKNKLLELELREKEEKYNKEE